MAETWAPTLAQVGAKIPTRTRDDTIPPPEDTPLATWTERTMPTADMVQPLIDGAVTSVQHSVASIPTTLEPLATEASAWRAAADIELAWPERDADLREVYDRLDARAKLALQELIDACNDAGTGADGGTPVYSFPEAPPWGDDCL